MSELKEVLQDHFALQRKLLQYRNVDDLSEAYDSLIVLDCYELLHMLYGAADGVDCDLISKVLKFLYLISSSSDLNELAQTRAGPIASNRNEVSFLLSGNNLKEEFDVLYRRNLRVSTSERPPFVGISNLAWQNGFVKRMEMLNGLLPIVSCYASDGNVDNGNLNLNQSITIDKVAQDDYLVIDSVMDALRVLQDGLKCDNIEELDCLINDYYYTTSSDIEMLEDVTTGLNIEGLFKAAKKSESSLCSVIFNMMLRRRSFLEQRDKDAQMQKEFGFFFDLETEASLIRDDIRALQNEPLSEAMKHSEVFKKICALQKKKDNPLQLEEEKVRTEIRETDFGKTKDGKIEKDSNGYTVNDTNMILKTRKQRNTRETKMSK
ncbi:hypothetical protein MP638_004100 [Amoeboaphelidium occidentale]|nr:hypothetical protein MP638_004100 [Amoeboaphelidium occidentale]